MGDDDEVEIDVAAAFGTDKVQAQRFAIYIPNKDQDGAPVAQEKWVEEALLLLSDVGGVATAMPPVAGAWRNPATGMLIREEPVVIYSYVTGEGFRAHLTRLVEFVKRLGRETNQGAVGVEFDGAFLMIEKFD